ncbi:hypothetical protein TNCV_4904881 [Trichonephila clavipes]|uniref:Uncharacterized protein n=1 Tax=Trichonephila clavipes TaxID=2585209 RepID=A0A8X6RRQ8_TRICX|nr:hypothetical protein TNCV_4904881 [Trichonephila clavipes]
MDPMLLCPGKGLGLPNLNIDDIAKHARFLILSLPNKEMSRKYPFIIHKALIGIGGEPKSIKKLRSVPQLSQTYAQAAKSSAINNSAQRDENTTKIKCSPLKLLQPLSSKPRTNISISTPDVSTSSSPQAQLLPSPSSMSTSNSESQPPIPKSNDTPSNNMFTPIESSSSFIPTFSSQSVIQPPSDSNTVQDAKKISKARSRKRKKRITEKNERSNNRN